MAASCASLLQVGLKLPGRTVRQGNPANDAPFGRLSFNEGQLRPEHQVRHAFDDLDIDAARKQAGNHAPLGKRRIPSPVRAGFQ